MQFSLGSWSSCTEKDVLLVLQVEFLKGVLTVPIVEDAREASVVTLCGICSHSKTVRKIALASTGNLPEDAGSPVSLQTDQYSQKQGGTSYSPVLFSGTQVMLMKAEASPLHYGAPRIGLGFSSVKLRRKAVKSPVAIHDDICVCLPSVSFLSLAAALLQMGKPESASCSSPPYRASLIFYLLCGVFAFPPTLCLRPSLLN